jgi:DNA helicase HerA-like ATPase
MGESEELLVSTVLARSVLERNKAIYAKPDEFNRLPPMLITMEEAQRVLGMMAQTGRYNIFAKIAREGRKFKTGLCAISQQPKLIDPEILSQFNTLFILGLADRRDRDILRSSARQDISSMDNEIQMLMPGEAVITSPRTPFALPVKIHLYEDYLGFVQPGTDRGELEKSPGTNPTREKEERGGIDDNFY